MCHKHHALVNPQHPHFDTRKQGPHVRIPIQTTADPPAYQRTVTVTETDAAFGTVYCGTAALLFIYPTSVAFALDDAFTLLRWDRLWSAYVFMMSLFTYNLAFGLIDPRVRTPATVNNQLNYASPTLSRVFSGYYLN